jgi:hypothetical protein
MLSLFEVHDDPLKVEELTRDRSPTSQAMNNALSVIGNPEPTASTLTATQLQNVTSARGRSMRFVEFGKTTVSRFNEPLRDQSPTRIGKRPCARDGHQACLYGNRMLIFGGDRHNMSFNSIHMLHLDKALQMLD